MKSLEFSRTVAMGEAERLWKLYRFESPHDLVLDDLALARGVIVTEGALDAMEARLIRQGNHGLIRVKADMPEEGRKRFAIAHELGHWELHGKVSQLFECTADDMVVSYKVSICEAEANYFASALLMPEFLFAKRAAGLRLTFESLSQLASTFRTSLTATTIRFVDTANDYVAVVASRNGKIQWWRGSSDFEKTFWLSAGSVLSPKTVAADVGRGSVARARSEVPIDAWSERGHAHGGDVFVEESWFLRKYGQVLTLLSLP